MIAFRDIKLPEVTDCEMQEIYEKIKTPVKYGAVLKNKESFTDSPTVFSVDGKFYMLYISIMKDCGISGYETHLAVSDDLKSWKYLDTVLRRNNDEHWDSKQCAGYAAFKDILFDGTNELTSINSNFYISYLAGNSDGYEPDPLYMGLCKTSDVENPEKYIRFDEPILMPSDEDSRTYETKTLYKSCMFEDKTGVTGYPYVNIYNAKAQDNKERIFLAVSSDGESWERYGEAHIFDMYEYDENTVITGDPQIILIDGIYVMLFFHFTKGKGAYNTFAASRDLIHWKRWEGKPLIEPTEEWENIHAHKPWFIRHKGINYHFYCAVNDKNERFIALSTSQKT